MPNALHVIFGTGPVGSWTARALRERNIAVRVVPLLVILVFNASLAGAGDGEEISFNRQPLRANPYAELPLGSIRPDGWLLAQLQSMRDGLTGRLDSLYAPVVGPRNAWLGGDGDAWERGLYWLDGLLPLAYILNDSGLIAKARPWVEWTLTHQREDGYIGPRPVPAPPAPEPGLQKAPREDWWPRMVMLKVLKQYYSATGDSRVLSCMKRYFQYQLKTLPTLPLDHWSFWANRRGGDNLQVVYWLYNQTGDAFLLDLGEMVHGQTFPWARVFLKRRDDKLNTVNHLYPYNTSNKYPFADSLIDLLTVGQPQSFHGVNIAQGIKEPVIYYQQHPDSVYLVAVRRALRDLELYHGQPQGMYAADEPTHGTDPTQGAELCSVVEMMFSLESMLPITGDPWFADRLERIAFNALPTQASDDYMTRQYFQTVNQVLVTRARRNFYEEVYHAGTDLCFGLLTGYPCCTCNMHQGWPKFVQNLWYASRDGGLAAFVYAPCMVEGIVGGGVRVEIHEQTFYPFDEKIRLTIQPERSVEFPLHLRIPGWCDEARITVNGTLESGGGRGVVRIHRRWKRGDVVELLFPMKIAASRWHHNAAAIERGPLVYALRLTEKWSVVRNADKYGDYREVRTDDPWNFGLLNAALLDPSVGFQVLRRDTDRRFPWTVENAPIELRTQGRRIPEWTLYNEMAGPLPHNRPRTSGHSPKEAELLETIALIPYGCTTLRITEFPVFE